MRQSFSDALTRKMRHYWYLDLWRNRGVTGNYHNVNHCFHQWGEAEVTSLFPANLYLTPEITYQHFFEHPSKLAVMLEMEIKRFKKKANTQTNSLSFCNRQVLAGSLCPFSVAWGKLKTPSLVSEFRSSAERAHWPGLMTTTFLYKTDMQNSFSQIPQWNGKKNKKGKKPHLVNKTCREKTSTPFHFSEFTDEQRIFEELSNYTCKNRQISRRLRSNESLWILVAFGSGFWGILV